MPLTFPSTQSPSHGIHSSHVVTGQFGPDSGSTDGGLSLEPIVSTDRFQYLTVGYKSGNPHVKLFLWLLLYCFYKLCSANLCPCSLCSSLMSLCKRFSYIKLLLEINHYTIKETVVILFCWLNYGLKLTIDLPYY